MIATTHPEFNESTESLEVAQAFADQIHGKTILITGVNLQGIGFATARAFVSGLVPFHVHTNPDTSQASQSPSCLIIAGRSLSKIQQCIDALQTESSTVIYRALELDLSSQEAVRKAASETLSWNDVPKIDILVNNAAVMNIPERTLSKNGIEMHFATNHIGHFLFTSSITPKLRKAAESQPKGTTRIINVTSLSPTVAGMRWSDINFEKINKNLPEAEQPPYGMHRAWGATDPEEQSYLPLEGYNQSKVANVLFGIALNKRLYDKYGILSMAVHPGVIMTELSRYTRPETMAAVQEMLRSGAFHVKTLGAGAATTLVAATDPRLDKVPCTKGGKENFGSYLIDCQVSDQACGRATSSVEAEKLWRLSEELIREELALQ